MYLINHIGQETLHLVGIYALAAVGETDGDLEFLEWDPGSPDGSRSLTSGLLEATGDEDLA